MNSLRHSPGSVGQRRPHRRTCRQCRTRKVRCDGRGDICSNCSRLGFDCSFRALPPVEIPSKCRVTRACVSCHSLKARCSGETPSCARCAGRGICCVYPPRSARYPRITPQNGGDSNKISLMEDGNRPVNMDQQHPSSSFLTDDRVKAAWQRYFRWLHRLPDMAFLHKPSLLQLYRRGQTGHALLLALVAVTSRLPGVELSETAVGAHCADLAEDLILKDIRKPSIFKVQALVLLVRYRMWTGSSAAAFSLLALAARFAFAFRINHESLHLPSFVQESRRRLMWTIYTVDSLLAEGLPEFAVCPAELIHLRLPCRDIEFELNFENETAELQDNAGASTPPKLGMLAYYVRITDLRDRVLRCTKSAASNPRIDVSTLQANLTILEKQLDTFASKLPPAEHFSEENFRLRSYSWSLPRYVMTHIWWHRSYCDLFRCLLPRLPESLGPSVVDQLPPEFVFESQTKCFRHSQSIAEICGLLLDLDSDVLILGVEIAECVYQAGRVLCLGRDINAEDLNLSAEEVTQETTYCLLLIKRLSSMYPVVSSIAADLEELMGSGSTHSLPDNDSPNPDNPTHGPLQAGHTHQIISKHSMLNQTGFLDDSHKLEMSLQASNGKYNRIQSSQHNYPMNESSSISGGRSAASSSPLLTINGTNNPPQGSPPARQIHEIEGEHNYHELPEPEFWGEDPFYRGSWDELGLNMGDDGAVPLLGQEPLPGEEVLDSSNLGLGFNFIP